MIELLPKLHFFLGLVLSIWTLIFLARLVLTWYPEINLKKGLWILVVFPTESILSLSRRVISPIGGVDVTPVVWVGLLSLLRELLVGQQGIISQLLLTTREMT